MSNVLSALVGVSMFGLAGMANASGASNLDEMGR